MNESRPGSEVGTATEKPKAGKLTAWVKNLLVGAGYFAALSGGTLDQASAAPKDRPSFHRTESGKLVENVRGPELLPISQETEKYIADHHVKYVVKRDQNNKITEIIISGLWQKQTVDGKVTVVPVVLDSHKGKIVVTKLANGEFRDSLGVVSVEEGNGRTTIIDGFEFVPENPDPGAKLVEYRSTHDVTGPSASR